MLLLATARSRRLLWRIPQRRSLSPLSFLRAGHRPEIFPDRDLWFDQQGIRRDEADALFVFWRSARFSWDHRHLCQWWIARPESAGAISIRAPAAIVGVSDLISRLCRARRHLAAAHLGADRSRRCAYGGLDVARRDCDETRRLRRPARGDESFSARLPNVADLERSSCRDPDRLWRRRRVGSASSQ